MTINPDPVGIKGFLDLFLFKMRWKHALLKIRIVKIKRKYQLLIKDLKKKKNKINPNSNSNANITPKPVPQNLADLHFTLLQCKLHMIQMQMIRSAEEHGVVIKESNQFKQKENKDNPEITWLQKRYRSDNPKFFLSYSNQQQNVNRP